jgi:hypothetical protein
MRKKPDQLMQVFGLGGCMKTIDQQPAEAEFVLEGTVYRDHCHAEGPFVDLTKIHNAVLAALGEVTH